MPHLISVVDDPPAPASPSLPRLDGRYPAPSRGRAAHRPTARRIVALGLGVALVTTLALALAANLARDESQSAVPLLMILGLSPFILAALVALMRVALVPRPVRPEMCLLVYIGAGALLATVAPFAVAALGDLPVR